LKGCPFDLVLERLSTEVTSGAKGRESETLALLGVSTVSIKDQRVQVQEGQNIKRRNFPRTQGGLD